MSTSAEALGAPDPLPVTGERRKHQRHPAIARVAVIREGDSRRINLPAELVDVSMTGLGLLAGVSLTPEERVRIRLQNEVRRFTKEVHGVVRWVQSRDNGKFRIGVELYCRFTALDIQLIKQVGAVGESGKKIWL